MVIWDSPAEFLHSDPVAPSSPPHSEELETSRCEVDVVNLAQTPPSRCGDVRGTFQRFRHLCVHAVSVAVSGSEGPAVREFSGLFGT